MLKNRIYLGSIISNKNPKPSFKSNKRIRTDESEWIEVAGMHEPIVEKDLFDLVQRRQGAKKRGIKSDYADGDVGVNGKCSMDMTGNVGINGCNDETNSSIPSKPKWEKFTNIFQGLVKCFDCGSSMVISRNTNSGIVYLCCTKYRNFSKDKCSPHFVQYNRLYQLVLEDIRENAAVIKASTTNDNTPMPNQRLSRRYSAILA